MKKINILFLAAMMLFGFACDDQLELEPAQSLSEAESLADIEGLQTASVQYPQKGFGANPKSWSSL